MNTYARSVLRIAIAGLALSAICFAASNEDATVYFVHGIPGRDVSATGNPQLPVDVLINDSVCYLRGFAFDSSSGPLTLPAGEYDVKLSPANTLLPCSNPPLVETELKLAAGASIAEVAALDSTGTPTLLSLPVNLTTVKSGSARLVLANTAGAGTLQVTVTQQLVKNPVKRTFSIKSGAQAIAELPIGVYVVVATSSAANTPLVSVSIGAENRAAGFVYFVGSGSQSALNAVSRIIPDVF